MEQMLTVREVAEALQVTEKSVRRWITERKLKATKLGRVLRIREADLEAFLKERET